MCQEGIPYTETRMKSLFNHPSQEEAGQVVHQFYPLVQANCSPDLRFFLCSIYAPVCTVLDEPIAPCRSLCESARDGCAEIMEQFGFEWPDSLECRLFPSGDESLCIGLEKRAESTTIEPTTTPG